MKISITTFLLIFSSNLFAQKNEIALMGGVAYLPFRYEYRFPVALQYRRLPAGGGMIYKRKVGSFYFGINVFGNANRAYKPIYGDNDGWQLEVYSLSLESIQLLPTISYRLPIEKVDFSIGASFGVRYTRRNSLYCFGLSNPSMAIPVSLSVPINKKMNISSIISPSVVRTRHQYTKMYGELNAMLVSTPILIGIGYKF